MISVLVCIAIPSTCLAQGSKVYEYDALGRLVVVERSASGKKTTYTHDSRGNRLSVIQSPPALVSIGIEDAAVVEGGQLNFTLTKSGGSGQTHTVDYATSGGTAGSADYTPVSGTISFAPNETTKTIVVQTTSDSVYENTETVFLDISNPTNGAAITNNRGVGSITNDDAAPRFAINNVTRQEGQSLVFTVTKSGSTAFSHNVNYATADNTAVADSDYVAQSGMLSFAPSETSKTITIATIDDTAGEQTENFRVNLSNPSNGATLSDAQGVGTITNDDNFSPIAVDDVFYEIPITGWIPIGVTANDIDPDSYPLIVVSAESFTSRVLVRIEPGARTISVKCNSCTSTNAVIRYSITDRPGGSVSSAVAIVNFRRGPPGGPEP